MTMTYLAASAVLKVGDVVRLTADMERFPNFIAKEGTILVVVEQNLNEMHPTLVLRIPPQFKESSGVGDNAREWSDCVVINDPMSEGLSDREEDADEEFTVDPHVYPDHLWNRATLPLQPAPDALPLAERLAAVFCHNLASGELDEGEIALAVERNRHQTNAHICHTHDFCDANMPMLAAFQSMGIYWDTESNHILWSEAWQIMKRFYLPALVPSVGAQEDEEEIDTVTALREAYVWLSSRVNHLDMDEEDRAALDRIHRALLKVDPSFDNRDIAA